MDSFLNKSRPPVYCPGCTHQMIATRLDQAMVGLGLQADKTVIVTDIGCSGLFDTFFNVHAVHGIHGRALTYATGLKLADPELTVIVTMGDGGLGIGGAHVLSSCRRNLDLTLLVLNNFNFGMTGGQFSPTTPSEAVVGSEFLNQAECPIDICAIAESAGATYVSRRSGLDADLADEIARAVSHNGFAVVETLGMCTGRYTKNNHLTPAMLEALKEKMPLTAGVVTKNQRAEYGSRYRELSAQGRSFPAPVTIEKKVELVDYQRCGVAILGSAGMRIVSAGDIVCYAGLTAGMNVSMKSDYDITVLRGPSVSEVLISPDKIGYSGLEFPSVVLALSHEGVQRRKGVFKGLQTDTVIIREKSVRLPETGATVVDVDFTSLKIKKQDWALAAVGILAKKTEVLTPEMLQQALQVRFTGKTYLAAMEIINRVFDNSAI